MKRSLAAAASASPSSSSKKSATDVTTALRNQCASKTDSFEFQIGSTSDTYHVYSSDRPDDERVISWFQSLNDSLPPKEVVAEESSPTSSLLLRGAIGLDCEWCPPWFRDNQPERINTIQLYSPLTKNNDNSDCCLLLSVGNWEVSEIPPLLLALLADESIAKVGVNVAGDGSRLARDFDCTVAGLLNLEQINKKGARATMELLCQSTCPKAFHIDKDAMESKVRLGNWAAWPLSEAQLKYASMDAVISFAIFLFHSGGTWATRCDLFPTTTTPLTTPLFVLESCQPLPPAEKNKLRSSPASSGKNANFFLMHQNRSIIPPNLNKKEHPKGAEDALHGVVIVISGVLDSMGRKEMEEYVVAHGGIVRKAITKATTHLVNDHGSVGPSKLKKCKAQGVPVVSEDDIFSLVAKSLIPEKSTSI